MKTTRTEKELTHPQILLAPKGKDPKETVPIKELRQTVMFTKS